MTPFRQPLYNIYEELSSGKNASESSNELGFRKNLSSLISLVKAFNPSGIPEEDYEDYENAAECMLEEVSSICQETSDYYTHAETTKKYNAKNGCNSFLNICNQLVKLVTSNISMKVKDKESSLAGQCESFKYDMNNIIKDLKSFKG